MTTDTDDRTTDRAGLEGQTRAELLEICRGRGLHATAWKKERMLAALMGQDGPVAETKKDNVLASQLERRWDDAGSPSAERLKLEKELALRTGRCLSKNGCKCEAYVVGMKDTFGWQMCECQHTNWSHAIVKV